MTKEKTKLTKRQWMVGKYAHVLRRVNNKLFRFYCGGQKRPAFHDVDRVCPQLRLINENYDVIRSELDAILPNKQQIPRYHEVDEGQEFISEGEYDWRTLWLYLYGQDESISNRHLCPRTFEIVKQIPNAVTAFFSILDAHKSVPAHGGPYLGNLRYSTGILVPATNPPTIQVKDSFFTWAKGESVLFDDSLRHQVENNADEVRVALIVDVLRPLPLLNRMAFRAFFSKTLNHDAFKKMSMREPAPAAQG